MSARIGIVVFPGSNCEQDCYRVLRAMGTDPQMVWHGEKALPDVDAVILPGGFAHGDYLRTGALARFSPIMEAVTEHARAGGLVLGICNGFQVLCEAGLLPGALRKNAGLKFLCKWTDLTVETVDSPFTNKGRRGDTLRIPINHFEGNWYADERTVTQLRDEDRVALRYLENPNGSLDDIAGILSEGRNVLGLMPHPERACEALLGSEDGKVVFDSLVTHLALALA